MFRQTWFKKLCVLPLLMVAGCKHPNPTGGAIAPPPGPLPENKNGALQIMVEDGDSSQAVYNFKGDKLLYVSKHRRDHQQDQVYEKDLSNGAERRLTFQNGSTYQPHYLSKEPWIVYSSSTDELKENPPLLHTATEVSKLPYPYQEPMEVYVHALKGFDIQRLTDHPGFDGEARFGHDGVSVIFTRVNGSKTEIVSFHRTLHTAHAIKGLGLNPTQYVGSSDGKANAWIEWDDSFGVSKLRLQKGKSEPVEVGGDMIVTKTDLSFSPDSKYLLWAQKDAQTNLYDLWITDIDNVCPQKLPTVTDMERRYPVISPDLKWLTFTMIDKKRSRIARMGFTPPTGPCPATP